MKNAILVALVFLMIGCTSMEGSVVGKTYSSKTGTFSIRIPDAFLNPKITDKYTDYGELVRFDLRYGASRRVERFKRYQHPISNIDKSFDSDLQLRIADENLLSFLASMGVRNQETLYKEIVTIEGKRALVTYRYLDANGTRHYRGVLIHVSEKYVNTFHYTHPILRDTDLEKSASSLIKMFQGFVENEA